MRDFGRKNKEAKITPVQNNAFHQLAQTKRFFNISNFQNDSNCRNFFKDSFV